MLKECKTFYQNLCSKFQTCNKTQNQLLQNIPKTVTTEHNENLTKTTKTELKEAIFQMENNKSPGIDGIPITFYMQFLYRKRLITIIPKYTPKRKRNSQNHETSHNKIHIKKGDLQKLRYWRPISLLCIDYKILTKILTNRLKKILPQIISEQQNYSTPQKQNYDTGD